jgi:hypothetical protein
MPAEDKPKTQPQARGYLGRARLQHKGDGSTNGPRRDAPSQGLHKDHARSAVRHGWGGGSIHAHWGA